MTRQKKSRKINSNGPRALSRTEKGNGVEGKRKSSKGKSAGSRQNEGKKAKQIQTGTKVVKDPRVGSKKPISLEVPVTKPTAEVAKPKKLAPEVELQQLEDNPRLLALLDRLEQGETLEAAEQQWLDTQLDRIEALMQQLGIEVEEEEEPQAKDAEVDLMEQFESGSDLLDQYKD